MDCCFLSKFAPDFRIMPQAVIDLGTNTFNLVIAETSTKEVLYNEKIPVRLGKNGISKGIIQPDAIDRAIQALLHYRQKIEEHSVEKTTVTATSAVRNASNQNEFVNQVLERVGFKIEVLSGDNEAAVIHAGVSNYLEIGIEPQLIIDIGGGSIEFIIANSKEHLWMRSLEIGGQRLMDQFQEKDPIDPKDVERLNSFLDQQLQEVIQNCKSHNVEGLIGSAGSFDTLKQMYHLSDAGRSINPINPNLPIEYFQKVLKEFISKDRAQRLKIPGMIEMRVDMIVVASLVIEYLIKELAISKMRVSAFSLKEGILFGNFEDLN